MAECIFCKIIAGEIPGIKIYEDDLVFAFLDIGPINPGHTLKVGSRIGVALKRALDCDAFNLHLADGSAAGQVVMHAHLHVIPRGVEDGFRWNWRQLKYQDGEAGEIAEKIIAKLKVD